MKLYSLPLSPFAARVRGAIYAKGLDIEVVNLPADWRTSAEYRAISPFGRVPCLVLADGSSLPESGVIVEYLEDAFPETPLRPSTPEGKARVRLATQVAELYVMSNVFPLFGLLDTKDRNAAAIDAQVSKILDGLSKLETILPKGTYAVGDQLSTADVFLTPMRFTLEAIMGFSRITTLLDKAPNVQGYTEVIQKDKHLSRVMGELQEAAKVFMAQRAAAGQIT